MLTARRAEREDIKMTDWKLNNFIVSIIKEELDIEENLYLNTDELQVEIDGDTVLYYIPVEYGRNVADVRLIIFPDFTYKIDLY